MRDAVGDGDGDRQSFQGVAGRRLDQLLLVQGAAAGKTFEQIGRGPVLDRAERVEPLELQVDVEAGIDAIQPDQGSGLIDVSQKLANVVAPARFAIGAELVRRLGVSRSKPKVLGR